VRASIWHEQSLAQNAATATVSHRLNRNYVIPSNNLLIPSLMGQGKLFQQSPSKIILLCPCTDNSKVATLYATTTKSSINSNEHLSSVKHCMEKVSEGFGQAHHADASTDVHCQAVEHSPRCAMGCLQWSAKNASSDLAALLLRPFPNGFLRAKVRSQ